jgi:hypothetical protein
MMMMICLRCGCLQVGILFKVVLVHCHKRVDSLNGSFHLLFQTLTHHLFHNPTHHLFCNQIYWLSLLFREWLVYDKIIKILLVRSINSFQIKYGVPKGNTGFSKLSLEIC